MTMESGYLLMLVSLGTSSICSIRCVRASHERGIAQIFDGSVSSGFVYIPLFVVYKSSPQTLYNHSA